MATNEEDVMELPVEEDDVIDTDDGGAIVKTGEDQGPPPADETDFYENLALKMTDTDLEQLAVQLQDAIKRDKQAREDRDKEQAEAIRRTGLGDEAPGGASFLGASRVVHPMLAKACIDFGSRAIAELFPANGPVKDWIPGEATQARTDKARRKSALMNWQFKKQMKEFYHELEQLLVQMPLGGSQYMRLVWDVRRKKPVPQFIPIDEVYLPFGVSNYYTSPRVTWAEQVTQLEFESRIRQKIYRDVPIPPPSQVPEQTQSKKASDKIEGTEKAAYNKGSLRVVYLCETFLEIEDKIPRLAGEDRIGDEARGIPEDEPLPYTVSIDDHNGKILAIVRNWEEEDETSEPIRWMTDFDFLVWRGAVGASLGQVIGSLSASATGALRALLDSAHINNIPTLLKLKGANMPGQSIETGVGQIIEIEGGVAPDQDIRKLLMAIPYNEPSVVLLQLLGFITQEADSVVRTTFEKFVESGRADMPVGTTLALIEQGMKVLAGIYKRLHSSMDRLIQHLHRLNRMYITDDIIKDETGELLAKRSDFEGPLDVIPTSDPEVFSDVQRFAQMQMVAQRALTLPMLYDLRKVEEMILERTKIPNAKDLLLPATSPKEMNAVNENMAMALGRPVAAFPEQDHLAHIQVHTDFYRSPMFGSNPLIAPKFAQLYVQHIIEHIVMWYVVHTVDTIEQVTGGVPVDELMKYRDPETRAELDRALAAASGGVIMDGEKQFSKLPPILQQALQIAQQYAQQQMPQDPNAQTTMAVARMTTDAQNRATDSKERVAMAGLQQKGGDKKSDLQQRQIELMQEAAREQQREAGEDRRAQMEVDSRERINTQDNMTALTIAQAETTSKERVAVSKGTGINPNPRG